MRQFSEKLAAAYSVEEAIFIEHFLTLKGATVKQHEGKSFTYSPMSELAPAFPFWSPHQIRRVYEKLAGRGIMSSTAALKRAPAPTVPTP